MNETRIDLADSLFVLPPDARVLDVGELSDRLRQRLGHVPPGSSVVTRPGHRVAAHLVAGPLAALIEEFRQPSRLTDAVLRFARRENHDPMATLDLAFDALALLVDSRILVPRGSPDAVAPPPSLAAGQAVAGLEIEERVRSLDDTELYRVRRGDGSPAALKIARTSRGPAQEKIAHEAGILARLAGRASPRLIETGVHEGRALIVMQWCDGIPIGVAAQQLRSAGDRGGLHRLVTRMLEVYARLHSAGVLHVDVHPGNLIVLPDGGVVIVDFGDSRVIGRDPGPVDPARTGVALFHDPQMAQALLAGRVPPAATPASEQYAVGVLAYLLLTGTHPIETAVARTDVLERITTRAPSPFAGRGARPWPRVEAVLSRALAREPDERFEDLREMTRAFADAREGDLLARDLPSDLRGVHDDARRQVRSLSGEVDPIRLAWFAVRTATVMNDPILLGAAAVLARRLGPGWEGSAVRAHVARARCDAAGYSAAMRAFADTARRCGSEERGQVMLAATGLLRDDPAPGPEASDVMGWAQEQAHLLLADSRSPGSLTLLEGRAVLELLGSAGVERGAALEDVVARFEADRGGDPWLWATARDLSGDERFLDLAMSTVPVEPILGAFAHLRLHQLTGTEDHVEEARRCVRRARDDGCDPLDIATVLTELLAPEQAVLPLVTPIGRSRGGPSRRAAR